jgi:septum formation protein
VTIVLASGSAVRARLMREAGLEFEVRPSSVDEDAVKQAFRSAGRSAADLAVELARQKALAGSNPGALVIGADQVLTCGDLWLDKPPDVPAARKALLALRGRQHHLTAGVALVRDGQVLWTHVDSVALTMRTFSEAFLDDYLAKVGQRILSSVGAYQLESLGVQLFDRIEGDYFTILGLPMLPLLARLREEGAVAA